jgi:carboxyl-terminal processing protease
VAVLIDEKSASTSEIMAGGLKDLGRARLFGLTTAGAALPSYIEKLPNGDGFQYAVANYVSEGGYELEGNGVAPDVEIYAGRDEFLEQGDPVLESALQWILAQ